MKTGKEICHETLKEKIAGVESLLSSAKACLKDDDFLQCAVRLEEISKKLKFEEFQMSIFETESGEM